MSQTAPGQRIRGVMARRVAKIWYGRDRWEGWCLGVLPTV